MGSNLQQGGAGFRTGAGPGPAFPYREVGAGNERVGADGVRVQVREQLCVYADLAFGAAGGVAILGPIPAGAVIDTVTSTVDIAFNAGTTNTLQVGTAGSPGSLVASGVLNPASATRQTAGIVAAPLAAATTYQVTYGQTGTAATAGHARVTIHYSLP